MKSSSYSVSDGDIGNYKFVVVDLRLIEFLQGLSINLQTGISSEIKSNFKNKIKFNKPNYETLLKIELELLMKNDWWIIGKFIPIQFEYFPYLEVYKKKIYITASTKIGIGFLKRF